MTVSSETNKVRYAADGVTRTFSTVFTFAANDEVVVTLVDDATAVETTWTEGTQYTLSGEGTGIAGTVTVDEIPVDYTPATGKTVVISLAPAFTQPSALPRGGTVSPKDTLEAMHDKRVRQILRLKDESDRSLKVPFSEAALSELPNAVDRASLYLAFDTNGAPVASSGVNFDAQDTAPASATSGQIWYNTTTGRTYVYYVDTDSSQWVEIGGFFSTTAPADSTAVPHTPAGTGAVATTVKARLDQTVSVKDFGAAGDGVTDDTAAIQLAIDAAATLVGSTTAYGGEGADVFFPQGEYVILSSLELDNTDGVSLVGGQGRGAVLKLTTDTTSLIKVGAVTDVDVTTYGNSFVNLHLRTELDSATTVGIECIRSIDTKFDNCLFEGFSTSIWGHKLSQAYITNCNFVQNGTYRNATTAVAHIHLEANTSTGDTGSGGGVHIVGCEFKGVASEDWQTNGLLIESCDGLYVSNCHFNANTYSVHVKPNGILDQQVTITDLHFDNCYFDADGTPVSNVYLEGDVDDVAGVLYQNIRFANCLFRGGTAAQYNFHMAVTDIGTFDGNKFIKNLQFIGCSFRQSDKQGFLIEGEPTYQEPYGVLISGCSFGEHNEGAAQTTGAIQVEAEGLIITGNTFWPNDTATNKEVQATLSLPQSDEPSFICTGNDFTHANYDTTDPIGYTDISGASSVVADNAMAGPGQFIDQVYKTTTPDATPVTVWTKDIPLNQSGLVRAIIVGKDEGVEYAMYAFEGQFYRQSSGNVAWVGGVPTSSPAAAESTGTMNGELVLLGNAMNANVTGIAATTINWTVHIHMVMSR